MKPHTLKELKLLQPGSLIPMAAGKVLSVSPWMTGKTEHGDWSLQNMMIQDDTEECCVKIGNHAEFDQTWIGKDIMLIAHQKTKGGMTGLRIEDEEYEEGGLKKSFKQITVSRSGEIVPNQALKPIAPAPESAPEQGPPETPEAARAKSNPAASKDRVTSEPKDILPPIALEWKELRYERVVNTGNYCSERMGVTIALASGARPIDALIAAQQFLEKYMQKEVCPPGAKVH